MSFAPTAPTSSLLTRVFHDNTMNSDMHEVEERVIIYNFDFNRARSLSHSGLASIGCNEYFDHLGYKVIEVSVAPSLQRSGKSFITHMSGPAG